MPDVVSKSTRSRMMTEIKGKDTKPELIIRQGLHHLGYRFRLHDKRLPDKPDLVFPRYMAVIQVQGCFWHGHDCHLFKWPSTRVDFWKAKITGNQERDARNLEVLGTLDWRTLFIWECALKGRTRKLIKAQFANCMHGRVIASARQVRLVGFGFSMIIWNHRK